MERPKWMVPGLDGSPKLPKWAGIQFKEGFFCLDAESKIVGATRVAGASKLPKWAGIQFKKGSFQFRRRFQGTFLLSGGKFAQKDDLAPGSTAFERVFSCLDDDFKVLCFSILCKEGFFFVNVVQMVPKFGRCQLGRCQNSFDEKKADFNEYPCVFKRM